MSEERPTCRGCFFCKSGKEKDVVRQFETLFPAARAIAPTRSRYRRVKDTAIEEKTPLLPGYVFFEVSDRTGEGQDPKYPADRATSDALQYALHAFSRNDGVLKLLRYTDGNWRLQGYDDRFARMLFEAGGNIGISQAYFDVGKRIRILDGFLKDYEGSIIRVNKKAKTVEVRVDLQGKKISMWLGYELVENAADAPT